MADPRQGEYQPQIPRKQPAQRATKQHFLVNSPPPSWNRRLLSQSEEITCFPALTAPVLRSSRTGVPLLLLASENWGWVLHHGMHQVSHGTGDMALPRHEITTRLCSMAQDRPGPAANTANPKLACRTTNQQTLSTGWRMPDSGGDALCSTAPISEHWKGTEPQQNLLHRPIPDFYKPCASPHLLPGPVTQAQLLQRRGARAAAAQRALLSSCVCSGRLILGAQLMTCGWPGDPGDWC